MHALRLQRVHIKGDMIFKYCYIHTARVYVLSTLIGSLLCGSGEYVNGMQMDFLSMHLC